MPRTTTIFCPSGRHSVEVAGSGANDRRAMREYGCSACRREAASMLDAMADAVATMEPEPDLGELFASESMLGGVGVFARPA